MTRVIPDAARLGEASSIRFRVSDDMVARFAALTGDRSPLHVSEAFARRSAYRRPVVHGMLPVGFVSLLSPLHIKGYRCIPMAMTGRFVAPAYAGDALRLTADSGQIRREEEEIVFNYRIEHDGSRAEVTVGTVAVGYEREPGPPVAFSAGAGGGMLVRPGEVNTFLLEQIEKGMKDRVDFRISESTLREFCDLLAQGIRENGKVDLAVGGRLHLPNLLSVLLFSTSVGVSLPGASATFLEFSARADREVALDTDYRLEGEVAHRSAATRIVKKGLVVRRADRDDEIAMLGKVVTLVNKPSQKMPTIEELRDSVMDWGLKGKVALITGASRGIGETTAKLFALFGARVIVNYHRGAEDATRVVQEITEAGGESVAIAGDVSSPDEVRALVHSAMEGYGAIHILVNNAARDYRPIPFLKLTWEQIQKDLDVIAKGAFQCCQEVIPRMLEQGGGKIINISSVAVDNPPPGQAKYVMAKSALMGLTRSLSIEFASKNIQVNLVVPNFVETDLVAHVQEGFRLKMAQETPMQRHASPVDVAQAILFLASSYSSFTTGQRIMVTGGGAPYL